MRSATGEITNSSSIFTIYVTIKCVQGVSIVSVFILYFCVVTTLWRKQVYHSNLVVLLTALPVSSLIAVCMSLAMDIFGGLNLLVSPLVDVIEFAMKSGMFGGALNLPNFIIERVAATVLVDKYEKCNESFPFFSSAMVLAQIGIVTFLIYLNTIGLISNAEGVIVFGIICAISIVLFSILPFVSRRAYEVHLRRGSGVSARYQTAENVRAARLLNKLMVLYVCFFVVENVYYYVIMFVLEYEDVVLQEILLSFFNILMVLEIFASVTVMAYSHPSLKLAICLPCCRVATVRPATALPPTAKPVTSGTDVRAIDGRQLLFNLDQEKEIYFRGYADMWNK
ncbi:hypothetical protein Y032_0060g3193 [Ancylostoma ceylanicum]|uniref:G-protein coupled receptors family 1 profile domain-containing protein n=1 Tax=Ancylostoma ceylanicum TaxID=53326 RepID=A0A016U441_9BILA|nr:hypothetical protein Y032_0060g3193 [Ancylostoma ceylanicum]